MKNKHYSNLLLFTFFTMCIAIAGCSEDSNPASAEETESIEVDLSNISEGEALAEVSDDTSFTWQGTATWDEGGRFNNRGTTYSEWIVTISGENGEELVINIVEEEDSSTMSGPDNGTYEVGAGMTQNSVRMDTGADTYSSDNSSEGTFEITQASDGAVLEIELEVLGLEIAGIGSQDEFIDVTAAIKANRD